MISVIALIVSIGALIATILQLWIQREHNENSLRPLGQIDLRDKRNQMYVRIINKGLGPMVIYRIEYQLEDNTHLDIEQCINSSPKSYMHVLINEQITKTLSPDDYIEIFDKIFPMNDPEDFDDNIKMHYQIELAKIKVTVFYTDMHKNEYQISRDLSWFTRHFVSEESVEGNPEHAG